MPDNIMDLTNIESNRFPTILIKKIDVNIINLSLSNLKAKGFWLIDNHAPIEKNKKASILITLNVSTVPILKIQRNKSIKTMNPLVYFIKKCIRGESKDTIIRSRRNQSGPSIGKSPPMIFQYTCK